MAKIFQSIVLCLVVCGALVDAACTNGTKPVSGSCDAYLECKDGVEVEMLCPDGLLYNPKSTGYPCAYPIDVECDQPQARFQPAQATDECPHQFGYFRMGDKSHCGQFKNCASGRAYVFDCPENLAWNPATYRCEWPDQVDQEDCDVEKFLGFKCPAPGPKSELLGEQEAEYEFFENKDNCQQYFICIDGRPRRIGCPEDQAFNPETKSCDSIENVNSCSADVKKRVEEIREARKAAALSRKAARDALQKKI